MEIYNEEVRDLLSKEMKKSLEVKERADIGVYVKDLSGYVVNNADDLDNIMKLGNKNRATGATKMNVESSRSHAIFSITVESSETDDKGAEHVKMGKLQLVDLAVSSYSNSCYKVSLYFFSLNKHFDHIISTCKKSLDKLLMVQNLHTIIVEENRMSFGFELKCENTVNMN